MTEPLRWGILGASGFARRHMAPAIHAARGNVLTAIASRDPARAAPFAALAPGIAIVEGYAALLARDDIDAVYVPLPNHLHVEWTIAALEAGKHVLCEKPIAMQDADFDRMIAARDASGKLAVEAFMIVHHPQWARLRTLLADGAIGDLVHVDAAFAYDNSDDLANIRNQTGMGGGGLRDIGVYTFGSVRLATGAEPLALTALLRMEQDFDTFAQVQAQFPGFTYSALVSVRMAKRQQMVFHGRSGVLTLTCPYNAGTYDQAEMVLDRGGSDRIVERWTGVNQYVLQVEAFAAAIRDGTPYSPSLEWSRGTQAMIDAALAGQVMAGGKSDS